MTFLSIVALVLSGCGTADEDEGRGRIGFVSGFTGVVSSEEPQAAIIGRDLLSAGGTAGDVAAAMGFAMTVTIPSAASLGGGGICIVQNPGDETPSVIDFLPPAPASIPSGTTRPSAVPSLPRGLFLVHARTGRLRWQQIIGPAENLARFGFKVPRAFSSELQPVSEALLQDPVAATVFRSQTGQVIREGDFLTQPDLAAVLGRVRTKGVGDLYTGNGARALVEAVERAGGSLSVEDLRDYRPVVRAPISFDWVESTRFHFAPPPAVGGAVAAEMLAILLADTTFLNAGPVEREHLIIEAAKRAFATRMANLQADGTYRSDPAALLSTGRIEDLANSIDPNQAASLSSIISTPRDWPETPSAVSYSVMDTFGGAAACTLTLNNVFGTGKMVPDHGFMLAAAPDQRGRTSTPLGPMILNSPFLQQTFMAAASSGGVTAPTALVNVIARAATGPQSLRQSIVAPRTHYAGVPDTVFVEADMPEATVAGLRARGHNVVETTPVGRVSAIYCPTGLPPESAGDIRCFGAPEPRGHGVALGGL